MAIYVVGSQGGDDYTSINTALAAGPSNSGDIFQIRDETFNEAVINPKNLANISLVAHASNTGYWVLDGGGALANGITPGGVGGGWIIEDGEIKDYTAYAFEGDAALTYYIRRMYIHDALRGVWKMGGGEVHDCIITDTTEWGILGTTGVDILRCAVREGGWVGIDTTSTCTVRHCLALDVAAGDVGIELNSGSTAHSCVVTGIGAHGILITGGSDIDGHEGNYVWGTWTTVAIGSAGGSDWSHASETVVSAAPDEPLFDNKAGNDYHVPIGAPQIGLGKYCGVDVDQDAASFGVSQVVTKKTAFNGTDEYATANSVPNALVGSDLSLALWARLDTAGEYALLSFNDVAGANRIIWFYDPVASELFLWDNAKRGTLTRELDSSGLWHLLVATIDETSKQVKQYLDGEDVATGAMGTTGIAGTDLFSIGMEYDAGPAASNFFLGDMAAVSVWNKVLTQSDVDAIYANGPNDLTGHASYANCIAYWPLGDGDTPPTFTDAKGAHDATMVNIDGTNIAALDFLPGVTPGPLEVVLSVSITGAVASDSTTARVTFSGPATSDATLTDITNYALTKNGADTGVLPTVLSITPEAGPNPSYVDVITTEMSDSQGYRIALAGITGVTAGNATFTGTNTLPTLVVSGYYFTSAMVVTVKETSDPDWIATTSSTFISSEEIRVIAPAKDAGAVVSVRLQYLGKAYVRPSVYTYP